MKLIVKYLSSNQYNQPSFVSTNEIHTSSYNLLVRLSTKLKSDFEGYLNVYQNDSDVVYLKTSAYRGELFPGGTYEIECEPIIKTNSKEIKYVILKLYNLIRIKEECGDTIYDF